MKLMLDTNTVSDLIRGYEGVKENLIRHKPAECALSAVTEGELFYGLANNPGATQLHEAVRQILATFHVLPWDRRAAEAYGQLKSDQKNKGRPLAELDLMIAAHAIAEGLTLVSSDTAFSNVTGLATENWRH